MKTECYNALRTKNEQLDEKISAKALYTENNSKNKARVTLWNSINEDNDEKEAR